MLSLSSWQIHWRDISLCLPHSTAAVTLAWCVWRNPSALHVCLENCPQFITRELVCLISTKLSFRKGSFYGESEFSMSLTLIPLREAEWRKLRCSLTQHYKLIMMWILSWFFPPPNSKKVKANAMTQPVFLQWTVAFLRKVTLTQFTLQYFYHLWTAYSLPGTLQGLHTRLFHGLDIILKESTISILIYKQRNSGWVLKSFSHYSWCGFPGFKL